MSLRLTCLCGKVSVELHGAPAARANCHCSTCRSFYGTSLLAALRVPPQLLGIVPQNSGGFGSIRDAAVVWAALELEPLQTRMLAINEWLGMEVIRFHQFDIGGAAG